MAAGTDPTKADTDNDGIQDIVEIANNMDPTNGADAAKILAMASAMAMRYCVAPTQNQPIVTATVFRSRRNCGGHQPSERDTDGDGQSDGAEKTAGTNATDATDTFVDTDSDGLSDACRTPWSRSKPMQTMPTKIRMAMA